jgi:ATPase subunit of ABC transporter with duplicated ATPase domains
MLSFRDVALRRGGKVLFSAVSFTVHAGQKVGLTGANGAGKSSLFAMIRGELGADSGELEIPAHLTLAHVAQETPPDPRPALDYALDGDVELREIEAAIAKAKEPLLVSFECFNLFTDPTGVKIPDDRKSIAYRFHYRAPDKTLVLKEIDAAHQNILAALTGELGVKFR